MPSSPDLSMIEGSNTANYNLGIMATTSSRALVFNENGSVASSSSKAAKHHKYQ